MSACAHPKERCHEFVNVCAVCSLRSKTRPTTVSALADEKLLDPPCYFRKKSIGTVACTCRNRELQAFGCELKGKCTTSSTYLPRDPNVQLCRLCESRSLTPDRPSLTWAVGLTTILKRKDNLLASTLTSLAKAGWENPHLFVDGGSTADWQGCKYPLTIHNKTHAYGNWWLGVQELYVANPTADRYMMVQDDVKFVHGLRSYLDVAPWPGRGYLNLYCFPQNETRAAGKKGFFKGLQNGLGALALVFNKESIVKLLTSEHMIEKFRPIDVNTGHLKKEPWRAKKRIDGGVVEAMKAANMMEFCHNPSLVQHTGGTVGEGPDAVNLSSLQHRNPEAKNFDEKYDLGSLLHDGK